SISTLTSWKTDGLLRRHPHGGSDFSLTDNLNFHHHVARDDLARGFGRNVPTAQHLLEGRPVLGAGKEAVAFVATLAHSKAVIVRTILTDDLPELAQALALRIVEILGI